MAVQQSSARGVSQSFKKALAARIGKRLIEMYREKPVVNSTGTDVVLVKNQLIKEYLGDMKFKKSNKTVYSSNYAATAGAKAGDTV